MTTLSTLQTWIEGDTGLSIEKQELLLASGDSVESDQGALQCWDADCIKVSFHFDLTNILHNMHHLSMFASYEYKLSFYN